MSASGWYSIKATSGAIPEISIYGEIGWDVSAAAFAREIKSLNSPKLRVRINSGGGSVFDGLAIHNILKGYDCTGIVEGIAASMGSAILMACKKIEMPANSFLMIHNPTTIAFGESSDLRKTADTMDKVRGSLVSIYQSRSGKKEEEVSAWMDEETWFTAQEAKDAGLCDEVSAEVSLSGNIDLSKFSKVPKALAVDSRQKGMANELSNSDKSLIDHIKAFFAKSEPATAPTAPIDFQAKYNEQIKAFNDLNAKYGELEKSLKDSNEKLLKAETDLKTAQDTIANPESEIEKRASAKLLVLASAQGLKEPVKSEAKENPASEKKDITSLKGRDRFVASFKIAN